MSPLLVVLNDHLSSSHPFSFFAFPFCFHCVLPQPIHLTASCPISLSSSFLSPPSILGYLFTTSLCHNCLHWSDVAGKCAFQRDRSGQEMFGWFFSHLLVGNGEKLLWSFNASRVCCDEMTREECVGEEKGHEGIGSSNRTVALGFLDTETCWEVTDISRVSGFRKVSAEVFETCFLE